MKQLENLLQNLQTADIKEIWKISSIDHKAAIYIKGGIYEN